MLHVSINEEVKKVEITENKVKFKAFGKTRPATKKKAAQKDDTGNQEEKDMDLLKRQSSKIEEQINLIKSEKLGRVGSIFKMKEVINGPKKKAQEPNAIKHPKTGDLIVSAEGIKKVTLEYCVENLQNNNYDEEVKDAVNIKKELHDIRMKDTSSEGFEVKKESFGRVLKKFSTKKTKTYNFLLKAGDRFKDSIYNLCKRMLEN